MSNKIMSTFKEYQDFADSTNLYKKQCDERKIGTFIPLVFGLTEEAGEVSGKFKKQIRDNFYVVEDVAKELGDVLWYLTEIASYIGYTLEQVADMNIQKLKDRQVRNMLHGSGDNR